MTDARTFYLVNDRVRANAVAAVGRAPAGFTVTIAEKKRSGSQNDFFHAICAALAKSKHPWAGKPRAAAEWKVLLVSGHAVATKIGAEMVPGLEGEFVNIRESTARMSVARATSLIEYSIAYCNMNGIDLGDVGDAGFATEAAA